jgi:hypothetical protein
VTDEGQAKCRRCTEKIDVNCGPLLTAKEERALGLIYKAPKRLLTSDPQVIEEFEEFRQSKKEGTSTEASSQAVDKVESQGVFQDVTTCTFPWDEYDLDPGEINVWPVANFPYHANGFEPAV